MPKTANAALKAKASTFDVLGLKANQAWPGALHHWTLQMPTRPQGVEKLRHQVL